MPAAAVDSFEVPVLPTTRPLLVDTVLAFAALLVSVDALAVVVSACAFALFAEIKVVEARTAVPRCQKKASWHRGFLRLFEASTNCESY